jgi:[ribosomal protein S5]-alanine N-acetyltransferase
MEIICDGFILRSWQKGDEESLAKNANNMNIADKHYGFFPHPYTIKDAMQWIEKSFTGDRKDTFFAIAIDGKAVGGVDFEFRKRPHEKTVVIGYWLGEAYWNRGIATNALKSAIRHIFENFDVERIEARVLEYNHASVRVLEKNGFRLEGIMRNSINTDKGVFNELLFSKIRSDS